MCIDSGNESLPCRFFVACCAIDLPGEEQASKQFCFESMAQLRRVEKVVFDGIAGAVNLAVGERGNLAQRLNLDIQRKRRREPVQVVFASRFALRLEEELMRILIGKGYDFSLDTRAITRSDTLDCAVVKRRIRQASAERVVHLRRGVDNPTRALFKGA